MREVPARPSRGLKSDFSDVLGSGAGSARSTRQIEVRMKGVYATGCEIASYSGQHDEMLIIGTLADRLIRLFRSCPVTARSIFFVSLRRNALSW
jgi:hypothetical protein